MSSKDKPASHEEFPEFKNPSFIEQVKEFFELDYQDISTILDEFEKKKDSFSTLKIASSLGIDVDPADSHANLVIFLIHLIKDHVLEFGILERELIAMGCSKDKVLAFVSKLRGFNETTINRINMLFLTETFVQDDLTLSGIKYKIEYSEMYDEENNVKGLLPIIRSRITLSSLDPEKEQVVDVYHTLDDFGVLARHLEEIYHDAKKRIAKFKPQFKEEIVCVPEDD